MTIWIGLCIGVGGNWLSVEEGPSIGLEIMRWEKRLDDSSIMIKLTGMVKHWLNVITLPGT
jgi:hypothetical protein